jgi:opacity protein-like surface antigen
MIVKKLSKKLLVNLVVATSFLAIGSNVSANDQVSKENSYITVEARYFKPNLNLKVRSDSIDYNGGSVDFKNDLGIADENVMEYRVQFGDGLRLSYSNFNYSGHSTLTQNLSYEGNTYTASTPIDSNLEIKYARATWFKTLAKSDVTNTKFLFDIKGFEFNTKVSGDISGTTTSSEKRFRGAIPTIGFATNIKIDKNINAFGEITGLPLGKYGHIYDYEAGIRYNVDKNVLINAGYRSIDLKIKDSGNGDNVQLKLSGPFFNAQYKF